MEYAAVSTQRVILGRAVLALLESARDSALVGFALAAMLLGNAFYDDRLILAGVPLNPFIFVFLAVVLLAIPSRSEDETLVAVFFLPFAAMLVTLLWSLDPEYGLTKGVNLLISTAIAALFLMRAIRLMGVERVLRILVAMLLVLLALALVFKIRNGFFDRQVPFFLNGPIVFGRLMAMGALAAFYCLTSVRRVVGITLFSLAVVWTASKGPILGLAAAGGLAIWLRFGLINRAISFGLAVLVFSALPALLESLDLPTGHRLYALADLVIRGGAAFEAGGQFADRLAVYRESWQLMVNAPFGVGLGGWEAAVSKNLGLFYPHNLLLEVYSECGFLLGSVVLIPFTLFIAFRWTSLSVLALFFLLVQQVSGDLLDARFGLLFSLLAVWYARYEPLAAAPRAEH